MYAADRAAERGERRLLRTFGSHALGYAFEQAITGCFGRFRCNVAFGDARAACGDNKSRIRREAQQGFLNCGLIVGNDFCRDDGKCSFF